MPPIVGDSVQSMVSRNFADEIRTLGFEASMRVYADRD
jgi:hypothetical protein